MLTTVPTLRQLAERDERVFPSYPQVARYFPGGSIEDARGKLGRAIERGDGPGLVVGGPGTGKSLLLQVLAAQYHEQSDIVLPACARLCTRRALLQSILFELGLPYRSRDEGELRLSLLDHLLSKEECPTGLLLLVDEAQTLPPALLDELRVLTNLVRGSLPRVRLILAGSSSLEECFTEPELESFSQRLTARCYLGPFNREETTQFIRAQLAASGATPDDIFLADACAAVFEATDDIQADEVEISPSNQGPSQKPAAETRNGISDPFSEKFDEEEVVLDNFAAWDDMFRRDVQRVVNRRDPEFATMVDAAIQASPPI